MTGFLASFRDLCLFRHGPEDIVYSPRLLIVLLAACAAMQVAFNLHAGIKPAVAAGIIIGSLAALGMVWVLLRGREKPERFVQTATALAAVYLVFELVQNLLTLQLPVATWREQLMATPRQLPELTGTQELVALAVVVLGIWQLCIWIGCLRRSLEISVAGGVLVFLMLVVVYMIAAVLAAGVLGAA
ncbi:MAG TPA: hypothetical protein VFL63_13780 [Rhodanobacteraceae bacterium]|nr:hypothetical protein [Rhodanobacteraceae bacterium]